MGGGQGAPHKLFLISRSRRGLAEWPDAESHIASVYFEKTVYHRTQDAAVGRLSLQMDIGEHDVGTPPSRRLTATVDASGEASLQRRRS